MMKRIPVPDSKKSDSLSKSIRIDESIWKALCLIASEEGQTPNSYVALVLEKYVEDLRAQGQVPNPQSKKSQSTRNS